MSSTEEVLWAVELVMLVATVCMAHEYIGQVMRRKAKKPYVNTYGFQKLNGGPWE